MSKKTISPPDWQAHLRVSDILQSAATVMSGHGDRTAAMTACQAAEGFLKKINAPEDAKAPFKTLAKTAAKK